MVLQRYFLYNVFIKTVRLFYVLGCYGWARYLHPAEAGIICEEEIVTTYATRIDKHKRDGTVRAESASQVPHANEFMSYEMRGSNHVQMKNDGNIGVLLPLFYSGGALTYFEID